MASSLGNDRLGVGGGGSGGGFNSGKGHGGAQGVSDEVRGSGSQGGVGAGKGGVGNMVCKFGVNCLRDNCFFMHPDGKKKVGAQVGQTLGEEGVGGPGPSVCEGEVRRGTSCRPHLVS